jgi:hypothetical protein
VGGGLQYNQLARKRGRTMQMRRTSEEEEDDNNKEEEDCA